MATTGLKKELIARLLAADAAPPCAISKRPEPTDPSQLKVDQLKEFLRDAKQKISGKKAELIERVVACGVLETQYQRDLISWEAANAGTLLRQRESTAAVHRRRDMLIAEYGPEPVSEAEVITAWDPEALRRQAEQENARKKQLEAQRAHERVRQQAEQERQRNVAKQKAAHKNSLKEGQKKRALEQDLTNEPRPQKVQRVESTKAGAKCQCGKSFKSLGALNDHLKMASKCPFSIKNQNQPTKQAAVTGAGWTIGHSVLVGGRAAVVIRDMRPKHNRATVLWSDTNEEEKKIDAHSIQLHKKAESEADGAKALVEAEAPDAATTMPNATVKAVISSEVFFSAAFSAAADAAENAAKQVKRTAQRPPPALGSLHPNLHKSVKVVKAGHKQQKQAAQLNPLAAQFNRPTIGRFNKPGALSTLGISQANLPKPLPKVGKAVDKPVAEPESICFAPYVAFRWS